MNTFNRIVKYLFDRVTALVGLVVLALPLAVIALLVRRSLHGAPVIFTQTRVGKDGQYFRIHKFRTMTNEQELSPIAYPNRARITPIGAKLRRHKLDELPELWDVLVGHMSFVGPRPDVPGYADKLVGDDRDVLRLRPGITGPATLKYRLEDEYLANARNLVSSFKFQDSGKEKPDFDKMTDQEVAVWYNDNVIYPDKVRLNCYYYRHYSFIKDIQMIICTVLGKNMKYAGEVI